MNVLLTLQDNFKTMLPDTERLEFVAFMGDASGLVKADKFNNVYVIRHDASVMKVRNTRVPNVARLPVLVGYAKDNPTLLQVLRMVDSYLDPPYPAVPEHAETMHSRWGYDPVFITADQILDGLAFPAADTGLVIQLRGLKYYMNGARLLDNMLIDFTAYVPVTGACWVLAEVDENKVITLRSGASVAMREMLTPADIPLVVAGQKPLFALKMYKGQTYITQSRLVEDIFDMRWLGISSGGGATSILWDDIIGARAGVISVIDTLGMGGDGFRFAVGGRLAVVANVDSPLIVARDVLIYSWHVYLENTGTSGSSIFDIHKNGVTVFTDQSKRPAIAYDNATGKAISGEADIISFLAGDIITLDIDTIAVGAGGLSAVGSVIQTVVVTVDADQYKLIGAADPVLTYTASVPGLLFTGALGRDVGETQGEYDITQGSLSLPAGYLISFVPGVFGIADAVPSIGATVIDTWSGSSSYIIDGDDATQWNSASRKPGPWCKVELDAIRTLVSIRLLQSAGAHCATQFQIETSEDDSAWTTQYTSPGGISVAETIITLDLVSAKYIKATCLAGDGGSGWMVYDLSAKGW